MKCLKTFKYCEDSLEQVSNKKFNFYFECCRSVISGYLLAMKPYFLPKQTRLLSQTFTKASKDLV